MTATAAYFGKLAESAFPSVKDDPERKEVAEIVREWLQALDAGRVTPEQFDQQITGRQMFLYCLCFGHHDQYYQRLCDEIDRRKGHVGMVYCRWRGWVTRHEWESARYDRAQERAQAPSKFQRGRD